MDLAILLATLAVLACAAMGLIAHRQKLRAQVLRNECAHNLKSIGNLFYLWADQHENYFPMALSQVIDGTEEFTTGTNAWRHFGALVSHGFPPRIYACPTDVVSSRWPDNRVIANNLVDFGNRNLSYFIGINAKKSVGSAFLAGDRNLTNGIPLHDGVMELTTNTPASWTDAIHGGIGNVLFADGSVSTLTTADLRLATASTDLATNRLQMPILSP